MSSLVVDVNVYAADQRSRRHVLNARAVVDGDGHAHRAFVLPPNMSEPEELALDAGTAAVVFSARAPVQVTLVANGGTVVLPVKGVLVLPAALDAFKVRNAGAQPVECALIQQSSGAD